MAERLAPMKGRTSAWPSCEFRNPESGQVEREVASLEQEVDSLEQEVASLEQEVASLEQEVASLEREVDSLERVGDLPSAPASAAASRPARRATRG